MLSVFAGENSTFLVNVSGRLFATGDNQQGQLGFWFPANVNNFTRIPGLNGVRVLKVACGYGHTVLVTTDGCCYVTGDNCYGQLGLGDNVHRRNFTLVRGLGAGERVLQVACGQAHIVLATDHGRCYVAGRNNCGQLGLGDCLNRRSFTLIPELRGVSQVVCGDKNTIIVTNDGQCYVAGCNYGGQLGIGREPWYTQQVNTFVKVQALGGAEVKQAACGRFHTVLVTSDGRCYVAGWNCSRQLGLGDVGRKKIFTEVQGLDGKVKQAACGCGYTVLVTDDGQCYVAGENNEGQIGVRGRRAINVFTKVQGLNDKVRQVTCGINHTILVTDSGQYYVAGRNGVGQLGLGHQRNRDEFTLGTGISAQEMPRVSMGH